MAPQISPELSQKLDAMRDGVNGNAHLADVMHLAEDLVNSMQGFFNQLESSAFSEFKAIAEFITKARSEISALCPNDMKDNRIPGAGAELEAIVKNTEEATNRIMAAAEGIMAADPSDAEAYATEVNNQVMEIFEACSFQDITGQRISKVVQTLRLIEERVGKFADAMGVEDSENVEETAEEKRQKEQLLNGPALNGPETSQDDIDAMFGDANGEASQDDIDSLFD